jgi:hypothetical protein
MRKTRHISSLHITKPENKIQKQRFQAHFSWCKLVSGSLDSPSLSETGSSADLRAHCPYHPSHMLRKSSLPPTSIFSFVHATTSANLTTSVAVSHQCSSETIILETNNILFKLCPCSPNGTAAPKLSSPSSKPPQEDGNASRNTFDISPSISCPRRMEAESLSSPQRRPYSRLLSYHTLLPSDENCRTEHGVRLRHRPGSSSAYNPKYNPLHHVATRKSFPLFHRKRKGA